MTHKVEDHRMKEERVPDSIIFAQDLSFAHEVLLSDVVVQRPGS